MVKHRVNSSAKDSKEIRKVNEFERRKREAELINQIKSIVPFSKRNAKMNKKEFLRSLTGYVKFLHSFKNTSVQPLPMNLDGAFQSLLRSNEINVFVCDGGLNIIVCSESSFSCLGYQKNEVNNRKLLSLVYERDRDAFVRQINALKEEVIESVKSKDFNITTRMIVKNKSKNAPEGHVVVGVSGTIEYRRELVTHKVAIQKAKNTHLSIIRYEDIPDHDSAIIIRGSIGLIKDPDSLTSQINYMFISKDEYRLVMDAAGKILFACHRMVTIIGYTPEEVIGKSAYEFIHKADRQMSLFAHEGTLRNNEGRGVIVHRLDDVLSNIVYLRSAGRLEKTDDTILFHLVGTRLSEEEGEKQLREYEAAIMPHCFNKSVRELQAIVDSAADEKLAQLANQLAASKMRDGCVNKSANSSNNDRLHASTSSSPSTSSMNSVFHGVLNESAENEFVEIASNAQSSPSDPSSQSSNLSTSSSSLPTLSSSTSLPSSSTQSPLSQSPSSQPCSSQSPPTYSLSSQSLTPESQFTQSSTDSSSQSMPSSASLSINYPVYATMNPYVPPTVMKSFPTNQIQNQYYQLGTNQLCGMNSGQNAFVTNPRQMHIIITTQCTIPEQQTFFSAPVNNPQIIFQPTFPQYQTYNYNQEFQNIVGLDINQELRRVNVNDFVSSLDYESEQDLKQ